MNEYSLEVTIKTKNMLYWLTVFFFSKILFINIIMSHSITTDVHLQNDIFAIVGNYKTIKIVRLPSITSRVDLIYKERTIPCTYKCKYTRVDYNM